MCVSSILDWIVTMGLFHIYIPNSGYSAMIFLVLQKVAIVVFDAKIIFPPVRWSISQTYIETTVGLWFQRGEDRFSWWLVMGFIFRWPIAITQFMFTSQFVLFYLIPIYHPQLLVFLIKFKLATCCIPHQMHLMLCTNHRCVCLWLNLN